jgi:hypothetical protein
MIRVLAVLGQLLALWLLVGCSTSSAPLIEDQVTGPSFQPVNVHRLADQLPPTIRRVAILPMVARNETVGATGGVALFEPVLDDELTKTRKFELVVLSTKQLHDLSGAMRLAAEEELPQKILQAIHEQLGCDAVLFRRLTAYRAYPPMSVGWSLKLVSTRDATIWWAADEVFDCDQPTVVNGARRYQKQMDAGGTPSGDSMRILNTPTLFGHYAAATLFATLPRR